MDLTELEALCAAAYDCAPHGQRPVGLPAPVVRAMITELRAARPIVEAVRKWAAARREERRVRNDSAVGDRYETVVDHRSAAHDATARAFSDLCAIADRIEASHHTAQVATERGVGNDCTPVPGAGGQS